MTRGPPILESMFSFYQGLPDCNTLNTVGFISLKKKSGRTLSLFALFSFISPSFWFYFFYLKNNSMLACRVVCCSFQSDRRIWVCISHRSDCRLKVRISDHWIISQHLDMLHQSERDRVCISHQSYHSFLTNDVMEQGGCAQRMT